MANTETTPGSPPADDHGGISSPSADTVARGYEEDVYDSRTVLSVPILVVLFFVLAFGTVTTLFGFIAYPVVNSKAHPAAAERNKDSLNDRFARLNRGPKNGEGQPRLEPLRMRSGESRGITQPELPYGNSPELHPEDIRPSPERFPTMYSGGGRAGLGSFMGLNNQALGQLFPTQKGARLLLPSEHVPSLANAGRGDSEAMVILPERSLVADPAPKKPEVKDPKQEKKPEGKEPKQPKKPEEKKNTQGKSPAPPPTPKGGKP